MTEQVPSIGRVVHFVLDIGRSKGEHRPAIIVRIWDVDPKPESLCQLQVFTDDNNDGLPPVLWATSVHQDAETKAPRTWHWPEFVPPKA